MFQDNNYEVLAGLRPKLIDELSKVSACKILDDAFTFVKQCVGFKPGNTEVEIFINNFIKKNVENGFIKELFLKYNVLGKLSLPKK